MFNDGNFNSRIPEMIEAISELLRRKAGLLADILMLTELQSGYIAKGDIDGLNKLVDSKQEKISAIDLIDVGFEQSFRLLKETLGVSSLAGLDASIIPGAGQIMEQVSEIKDKITKISDLEKSNNTAARRLLDSIGDEVKKLNQGMKVNNAYMSGKAAGSSYFIDKKK